MEVAAFSEMSASAYKIIRRHNPEDTTLYIPSGINNFS
jgi:hypothetical protein